MREQIFEQPDFIPIFDQYQHFADKRVGITGANGILGRIIVSKLTEAKVPFFCFENDITNPAAIHDWCANIQFDHMIHLAAIVPLPEVQKDPLRAFDVNSIGTYYLCRELARSQRNCRVFIASSSHVYKNQRSDRKCLLSESSEQEPVSVYGRSKLMAEQISVPVLQQSGISYCIGRIFSFTHKLQKEPYLVPTLRAKINLASQNDVIEIYNPDSVRDIMDAETVVDCIFYMLSGSFDGTVNIGTGCGLTIKKIAEHQARLAQKEIEFRGKNVSPPDSLIADTTLLRRILSERKQK